LSTSDLLKSYRVATVSGDRYAAQWVREAFKRHGVTYRDGQIIKNGEPTYLDRSSAYLEVEPLFASGLIALLDHPVMAREFVNLERRPSQGGKDRIEHPRGKHDDYANAVALAIAITARGQVSRSSAGKVLVVHRELRPAVEVLAKVSRWHKAVEKGMDSSWRDPRGEDPNAPPPPPRDKDPWGRRGTRNPFGRPA
jgi:hypothetical protein